MKKVLLFAVAAILLFCSRERLFESPKDKLDRLVCAHWDAWKAEGKDTTMCFIDIAKVVPIEWDTMVYVLYYGGKNSEIVTDYINKRYWPEYKKAKGGYTEGLHFWKNGKLVYRIPLWQESDDENSVYMIARDNFLVRDRSNAELHLEKEHGDYILRGLSKEFLDSIRCVQDYKAKE